MINFAHVYHKSVFFSIKEKINSKLRDLLESSIILQWFFKKEKKSFDLFISSKSISLLFCFLSSINKKCKLLFQEILKRKYLLVISFIISITTATIFYLYYPKIILITFGLILLTLLIYRKIELGFILLSLSLSLSPKVSNFFGFSANKIPLYISDFIVLIVLIIFLIKSFKEKQKLVNSSLDLPIIIYLFIAIVSTTRGVVTGTIDEPIIALLYLFKQIEYFLIFYLVLNHIKTKKQIKTYLVAWFFASCLLSFYGIYEHFHPFKYVPTIYRIFERGYFFGQATHFGGFLVFFICISISLFFYAKRLINKFSLTVLTVLMFFPFLWTYSRQSYLAFIIALTFLCILYNKKMLLFLFIILLIFSFILPDQVITRLGTLMEEFKSSSPSHSSFAGRMQNWKIALNTFPEYPLLGVGLGARHRAFYDNYFVFLWSELGLLGLFSFLWLLINILKQGLHSVWFQNDRFLKALAIGFLAGFAGITIQSFASVTFIITRIAGPMWFMLGLIVASLNKEF